MKVLGLIVEYNPFHNGHLYHIKKAKEITSSDYIICVMSGNYVQRGEPAILNKWARTKIALNYGIDLVIELPFVFSMSSAEYFSMNAIKILDSIGIVDCICFGSESGKISNLMEISNLLTNENTEYSKTLKKYLSKGISYPLARQKALFEYFQEHSHSDLSKEISTPNNILGIEYLKALKRLNSKIKPYTIARIGNSYDEQSITGNLSSATSIRNILNNDNISADTAYEQLKTTLPEKSYEILLDEIKNGNCPVKTEMFDDIIISTMRRYSAYDLKNIPYISEGLENKFKKNSDTFSTIEKVVKHTKSKRYTHSRIQRTIFNILVGLNYEDFESFHNLDSSIYARILGFNNNGIKLLLKAKNRTRIPITTKFSILYNSCNKTLRKISYYEKLSTDLYVLAYKNPDHKKSGQDFTNNFIRF
jgi:predicted nucleotidyltransferase